MSKTAGIRVFCWKCRDIVDNALFTQFHPVVTIPKVYLHKNKDYTMLGGKLNLGLTRRTVYKN